MRAILPPLLIAALPALGQDALPLRRGFYVQEPTSCARASNATLLMYDGRGFGASQASCRIVALRRAGDAYDIRQDCRDIRSGARIEGGTERIRLTPTGYTQTAGGITTSWRYCPQSQLPEPWRGNAVPGAPRR